MASRAVVDEGPQGPLDDDRDLGVVDQLARGHLDRACRVDQLIQHRRREPAEDALLEHVSNFEVRHWLSVRGHGAHGALPKRHAAYDYTVGRCRGLIPGGSPGAILEATRSVSV